MKSTFPLNIYLVKTLLQRCCNVCVKRAHCNNRAIYDINDVKTCNYNHFRYTDLKTLLQLCKNVRYYSLAILKKKHILLEYLTYFFIICLIYNYFYLLRTRVIYIAKPDIFGETLLQRCCNVCPKGMHCNIPDI